MTVPVTDAVAPATDGTAGPAVAAAVAAAGAALAALPLPAGAVPAPATLAEVPADWRAVTRRFAGAASGVVALALAPEAAGALTTALAAARGAEGGGEDELPAACVPALDAAVATLGPAASQDPEGTTGGALAALGATGGAPGVAAVLVDGVAQAYVVLDVDRGAGAVPGPRAAPGLDDPSRGMDLLRSVPMEVTAEIGRTRMTVQELLSLTPGALVELDRPVGSPADVLVNGRLFARGEVVVVDEDFAIRIIEIVDGSADAGT